MILEQRGAIMQAAVALAEAIHPNPTVQQVQQYYDILVNILDTKPPDRGRADPSQYTANAAGR